MAAVGAAALLALLSSADAARTGVMASRGLLQTNLQYLEADAEARAKTSLSHGGIAGIIIALCLLPFMCICLIWAIMYGKKTANDVAPARKSVGVEEVAAPVEAAPAATA